MKIARTLLSAVLILATLAPGAAAKDVYVKGYLRKDGTYVRPHVRSSPNAYKWDNYGPSKTDEQLMNPTLRDNDGDGIINAYDRDDDNDGIPDEADSNQYGSVRVGRTAPVPPPYFAPISPKHDATAAGVTLYFEVDIPGGDYAQGRPMSLADCYSFCVQDTQCRGFSYVEKKQWCWVKSTIGNSVRHSGVVSWVKR